LSNGSVLTTRPINGHAPHHYEAGRQNFVGRFFSLAYFRLAAAIYRHNNDLVMRGYVFCLR
jgi:hypothetical protein